MVTLEIASDDDQLYESIYELEFSTFPEEETDWRNTTRIKVFFSEPPC